MKVEAIYKKEGISGNEPAKVLELSMKGVLTSKKRFDFEAIKTDTILYGSNPHKKVEASNYNDYKSRLRVKGLLKGVIKKYRL